MEPYTILIVAEQPEQFQQLQAYLTSAGFGVLILPGAADPLPQIEQSKPVVILITIPLSALDGFELCRQLKAQETTREIPVIFIIALNKTVDRAQGIEAGGIGYIIQPFQPEEVLARINAQITIRNLYEQLQHEHERFRSLAEATLEGILIHDKGQILEINQAAENLFGWQRTELIGKNVADLVAPEFRQKILYHRREEDQYPYEAKVLRKDGALTPVEVHPQTMFWQGRPVNVTAMRDLTWRKILEQENIALKAALKDRYRFGDIIGKSPAMQEVYELIAQAAATEANVLITGESGTGKELVARTIHRISARKNAPFVVVNCGAIPENLFESMFFGHYKGAFTGAYRDHAGFFEAAQGGTLFLDEVGELNATMQVKLLRALENREYTPVGSNASKRTDVRIIAATNQDLKAQKQQGTIRADFFYRIYVVVINLPPLRKRKEDIALLVTHILEQQGQKPQYPIFPGAIMRTLIEYDWPGNVRELQNEIQRYLATRRFEFVKDRETASDSRLAMFPAGDNFSGLNFQETLEAFEKQFLRNALAQHHWNRSHTAVALSMQRKTLQRKMKKYGISDEQD